MQDSGNKSLLRAFFRKKWVLGVLAADVIIIIVVIIILISNASKTATINFNVAPIDATISVNGDSSYTNGQYSIAPGNYEVTITREGLESKIINIKLGPNESTAVSTFLHGQNDNLEFYEYKDNYMSFEKLQEIASAGNNITTDQDTSAGEFIKEFSKNYDLYQNVLPINYISYKEDSNSRTGQYLEKDITIKAANSNEECKKTLCIEAAMIVKDDKNAANNLLQKKGFNLEYVEIVYKIY